MRLNEVSFLSEGSMLMVRKRGAPERKGAHIDAELGSSWK